MITDPRSSGVRLTGFAAASLWHRRLVRTSALNYVRVQPRVAAELVMRPLRREDSRSFGFEPGRAGPGRHAA
jgi:hypothetical protein